jgi:Flp pilus assembly protein TadG
VRRIDPRREDGVAMAEFALIVPVFLLLLVGIISFGRVFFVWNDANHLANETARWAVVDQNPYAPAGATPTNLLGGRTLQQHVSDNGFSDADVCITFQDASPAVGEYLTVRVWKPVRLRINLPIIRSLDFGFTVRGTSTQRIENLENTISPTSYDTTNNNTYGNLSPTGTCP